MREEIPAGAFGALQCMVNHARNDPWCRRLAQAKARAREAGFTLEEVDAAVKLWADYEAEKRDR